MNNRLGHLLPAMPWRSGQPLLRTFIALAALGLSILFASQSSDSQLTSILMGLVGLGGAVLFLRWPNLGLLALIFASLVVPFAVGTGTNTRLNITVLMIPALVALWLLDMAARQRRIELVRSRPMGVLLAFTVVVVLSFIAGQLPWFVWAEAAPMQAQVGGLAIFLLATGTLVLVAHQVKELYWLKWAVALFLALTVPFMIGQAVVSIGKVTNEIFLREAVASAYWIWVVALSFSQAAFNTELRPVWRLALGALCLLTFGLALGPRLSWASGWLPPLVVPGAIILAARPRLAWVLLPVGVIAAALLAQPVAALVLNNEGYSLLTRWEAWSIIVEIAKASPILGLGPANYYYYTPLFPILGWRVQFNSHNQYIDIIAQTGLLGFVFLLWFLAEMARLAWRLRHRSGDGFSRAYVYGVFGAVAGTAVSGLLGDWFLPFVYNVGVRGFRSAVFTWIFFGGLIALEQIILRREKESGGGEPPL
jgi:hypothetical protein